MELAELTRAIDDSRLQLFVFGPGTGEGLALRAPGIGWIVVDSCGGVGEASGVVPGVSLIEAAEEPVVAVVLTHPHTDHAVGIDRFIERFEPRWVGCVPHFLDEEVGRTANRGHWYRCRKTWAARAAIKTYWIEHPERRWELLAGSIKTFGDLELQALHPSPTDISKFAERTKPNANDLSTPLAVSWKGVRLVLGADLPEPFWPDAIAVARWELSQHQGLKVSHHASKEAQSPALLGYPNRPRHRVATPWQKGSHLPNYDDGHGVDLLLRNSPELIVTSLTRKVAALPDPIARRDLAASLAVDELKNGMKRRPSRRPEINESWSLVSFDEKGSMNVEIGAEALRVLP